MPKKISKELESEIISQKVNYNTANTKLASIYKISSSCINRLWVKYRKSRFENGHRTTGIFKKEDAKIARGMKKKVLKKYETPEMSRTKCEIPSTESSQKSTVINSEVLACSETFSQFSSFHKFNSIQTQEQTIQTPQPQQYTPSLARKFNFHIYRTPKKLNKHPFKVFIYSLNLLYLQM